MNKVFGLAAGLILFLIGSAAIVYAQQESGGIPRLDELVIYNANLEEIQRIQFPADGPPADVPQIIVPDNHFYVELRGTNIGAAVNRGGFLTLSVAYPYLDMPQPTIQFYDATVPPTTSQRYILTADDPQDWLLLDPNLWPSDSPQRIRPTFPVAEIWSAPWNGSENHAMRLSVTLPEGYTNIQLSLRGRMSLFAYENFDRLTTREKFAGLADPGYRETTARDEQGYPVWETVVTVDSVQTAVPTVPLITASQGQEEAAPPIAATDPSATMPSSFQPSNRFWFYGQIVIIAIGVVAALYVLLRVVQQTGFLTKVIVSVVFIVALSGLILIIVLSLASAEQFGNYINNPLWTGMIIALVPALVGGIFGLIKALLRKSND